MLKQFLGYAMRDIPRCGTFADSRLASSFHDKTKNAKKS